MLQGPQACDTVLLLSLQFPPLKENDVSVTVSDQFNIRHEGNPFLESASELWSKKLEASTERGSPLFNGTKFRFARCQLTTNVSKTGNAGGKAERTRHAQLQLGVTSYKDLVATNMRPKADIDAMVSLQHSGKPQVIAGQVKSAGYQVVSPFLSQAFGNEALLVTKDDRVVLFRRGSGVAEYGGVYCGPGGHPEPERVGLPAEMSPHSGQGETNLTAQLEDVHRRTPDAIVKELFQAPIQEIQEEVGIPAEALTMQGLYGIVGSTDYMKPCALFFVQTTLTSTEVQLHFSKNRSADESDGKLWMPTFSEAADFVVGRSVGVKFTPCAATALSYLVSVVSMRHCVATLTPNLCRPFPVNRIKVELSPSYNRQSSVLDEKISQKWAEKLVLTPKMFNATKFRLGGVVCGPEECIVKLGITDYKEYIGTNLIPVQEWLEAGVDLKVNGPRHMGQALGVEALLTTSDDQIVLFRRSMHVADYAGFYCCPGGHPEPSKVLPPAKELQSEKQGTVVLTFDEIIQQILSRDHAEDIVRDELWTSAIQEVHDELGIPMEKLEMVGLFGIVENRLNLGKPDMNFQIRTTLTAAEVIQCHQLGAGEDAFESEGGLYLHPLADLRRGVLPPVPLAPPTVACLLTAIDGFQW